MSIPHYTTEKQVVSPMFRWEKLESTLQDMAFLIINDLPTFFYSPDFYSKDLLNYFCANNVITNKEAKYIRAVMTARNISKSDWSAVKELYDTKISRYFRRLFKEAQKDD